MISFYLAIIFSFSPGTTVVSSQNIQHTAKLKRELYCKTIVLTFLVNWRLSKRQNLLSIHCSMIWDVVTEYHMICTSELNFQIDVCVKKPVYAVF